MVTFFLLMFYLPPKWVWLETEDDYTIIDVLVNIYFDIMLTNI